MRARRGPLRPSWLTLPVAATALAAVLASGCVRRSAIPDDVTVRTVERETAPGVVAIATVQSDNPSHVSLCSGAVIAPNLLLTARHCVSRAVTATPSCDARGKSHNGEHLSDDVDPAAISVYVGGHVRPDMDAAAARAVRSIHPVGNVLCDADVAFLVLDRDLEGVTTLAMRLHGSVQPGDYIIPVGFGGGPANIVGLKVARDRSRVLSIGPAANAETGAVLGPREFEVDRATCRGDSGGPAVDAFTGEIVGVVSRGGSCSNPGNHVYTRVDAYVNLARRAIATARHDAHMRYAARTMR